MIRKTGFRIVACGVYENAGSIQGVVMSKSRFILLTLYILLSIPFAFTQNGAQTAPAPTQRQERERKTSEPYTGDLSIFDTPGRDERLQINRVMNILRIESGKNVADIGAGSGWFTVRAAKRVGAEGKVFAADINPAAVSHIQTRAQQEQLSNVTAILSKPDDPLLQPDSVDAVLLLKTYHEIAHPVELLRNLRPALRAGAKIGVIDRNGNGENHGVGKDVVIREAHEAGYRLLKQYDFVKDGMDYFLVFTPSK
jgi:SAM-dependent methyltransferase